MPRKLTPEVEQRIVEMYTTPLPDGTWCGATTIATKLGVTTTTIYNVLKRNGVPSRPIREAYANGKRTKPIKNLPPKGESPPLCACGCGEPVQWFQAENRWFRYVKGHYAPETAFQNPRRRMQTTRHAKPRNRNRRKPAPRPRNAPPIYWDRTWLFMQYVVLNKTVTEIGNSIGVHAATINKALIRANIPRRSRSESRIGKFAGPLNPAWKGGVTPERQRLYKRPEWRRLVQSTYRRDGFLCQRCGTPKIRSVKFHAHHITPWADCESLRLELDNLITLCQDCHLWVHSLENEGGWFLAEPLR